LLAILSCAKQLVVRLPFNPFPILGNVSGVEKFAGGRVFAEFLFADRAAVHQCLSDHRQTRVDGAGFANIEHEVRVLDDVHPEPQREARYTNHTGVVIVLITTATIIIY